MQENWGPRKKFKDNKYHDKLNNNLNNLNNTLWEYLEREINLKRVPERWLMGMLGPGITGRILIGTNK